MWGMTPFFVYGQDNDSSENQTVLISVFERDDCGHCKELRTFLEAYQKESTRAQVRSIDIYEDEGAKLFQTFTDTFALSKVTPIILVADTILVGFGGEESTGVRIKELVSEKQGAKSYTPEEYIERRQKTVDDMEGDVCDDGTECSAGPTVDVSTIKVPIFGALDVKKYSLGFLAMLLGFVDGFNPCAMWVLVMFLTLLLKSGSRKRMFQVAGLFILAETIMYFAIMSAWITAWDFIGLDRIVTPLVGLVAVGAGIFFLYEYKKYKGACKVVGGENKKKIYDRMERLVNSPLTLVGIAGILGLAFSVNIIEFACSIGIPQTFTKILDLNMISWGMRQVYIFVYILFYMIDDFVVFGGALLAFAHLGLTTKYSQFSNLVGGILMVMLGLLLLFAPHVLVF